MRKKFICVLVLLVIIIGSGTSFYIFKNIDNSETHLTKKNSDEKEENVNKNEINSNQAQENAKKDSNEKKIENLNEETYKNDSKNNTESPNKITKKTENTSNVNSEKQNINSTKEPEKKKEEQSETKKENNEAKSEIKHEEEKTYINVPSPNSWHYSIHHGVIDYDVKDYPNQDISQVCYNKSLEILFKNTEDIQNAICYDVVDDNGTILGQYLQIVCLSGNCNKYKK